MVYTTFGTFRKTRASEALVTHASKMFGNVTEKRVFDSISDKIVCFQPRQLTYHCEKPNIRHQLLTSANSPILSATVKGQAVRQAAVPFAYDTP